MMPLLNRSARSSGRNPSRGNGQEGILFRFAVCSQMLHHFVIYWVIIFLFDIRSLCYGFFIRIWSVCTRHGRAAAAASVANPACTSA
jgi:hypothetical protein